MTKCYLEENSLLAVPLDKGTGVCVMESDIYTQTLNEILNLEQPVKINPTRKNVSEMCLKEEEDINNVLQDLHKEGKIDKKLLKELKSTGSQLPRFYGLAKVHKNNVLLCPVLSMPGSPYDKFAQKGTDWLSVVLEPKINSYSEKSVKRLKRVTLDADEAVISFDLTLFYTNVPVKETVQEAAERLYCCNAKAPPVHRETFIILATLSCTNVLMQTHDGTYKQIDGLAMGSAPATPLSNIWF